MNVFLSAQKICRQLRVPDILGAHGKCKLEKDGEIHKVILLLKCTIVKLRMIISAYLGSYFFERAENM